MATEHEHSAKKVSLLFISTPIYTVLFIFCSCSVFSQSNLKLRAAASVLKGIFRNPIVLMSILGICANFVFGGHIPSLFDNILKTLGNQSHY